MNSEPLSFAGLTATLKAAGETTRLRILVLLAETELTVSDLTEILRQSQPRLSRHLRLLAEAGLVERFREGSWAFFRLGERGSSADIARALIAQASSTAACATATSTISLCRAIHSTSSSSTRFYISSMTAPAPSAR